MKCEEVQEQLSEYLDTLQGGAAARAMETHMAGCARCAEALADLAECRRLVAALPQVDPPIGFTARVMAHVRESVARPNWRQRLFFPLPIKLPIQATAILAIGVLSVYLLQKEQSHKQLWPGQQPPSAAKTTNSAAMGDAGITQDQPLTAPAPEAPPPLSKRPPSSEKEITEAQRRELAAKKDPSSSVSSTSLLEPSRAATAPAGAASASGPPAVPFSELPARRPKPIAAMSVSQSAGAPMTSPWVFIPDRALRVPLTELVQPVADFEVVVRRHPLTARQEATVPEGSSSLSGRNENDNARIADGNPAAARFYSTAAPSGVMTSWHTVPANRYQQFKKDLTTQGVIESEIPLSVPERESLFKSAEPLTIKVTMLPPLPSDAAR